VHSCRDASRRLAQNSGHDGTATGALTERPPADGNASPVGELALFTLADFARAHSGNAAAGLERGHFSRPWLSRHRPLLHAKCSDCRHAVAAVVLVFPRTERADVCVFDREGIPGVWFYSLDCNRCWAVIGARLLGTLPYFLAEMSARRGEWIDYSCRRRGSSESARFRYRASGPNEETVVDSLEFFLLERYYLFAFRRKRGTLLRAQVTHAPYQFRAVDLAQFSTVPAQFNGFSEISRAPDHICVVDGFDINVFRQEKVRAGNAGKSTNAKASSVHLRS
jgi:uncharacterized protein YqjF (DUF2071 family)